MTGAERQRRYRERQKRAAAVEAFRAEANAVPADASCACCRETNHGFLVLVAERVFCRNCAPYALLGLPCPHRAGIVRRLR